MKRLVLLGLIMSGPAFGENGDYTLWGCDNKECIEIESGNLIEDFDAAVPCEVNRTCRPGDTSGGVKWGDKKPAKVTAKSVISSATGIAGSVVGAGISGLKSAAVGAGYTHLTATLSGPSGHVTLKMNLQSSTWSVSGGGGIGSGGPDPIKNIP